MNKIKPCLRWIVVSLVAGHFSAFAAQGADAGRAIALGKTGLVLTAPEAWQRKEPSSRIVEHEFAAPPAEGDSIPGRVTVMGAGGTVEANIDRWIGQFSQPDGADTKKSAKVEKRTIAGQQVQIVDISGTYKDSPGPFSGRPAVDRPDFRMLATIIVTEGGNYFVKFYGPRRTIAENEKNFMTMIDGLAKK